MWPVPGWMETENRRYNFRRGATLGWQAPTSPSGELLLASDRSAAARGERVVRLSREGVTRGRWGEGGERLIREDVNVLATVPASRD